MPAWVWVAIAGYVVLAVVFGLIAWGAGVCGKADDRILERAVREFRRRGPSAIE